MAERESEKEKLIRQRSFRLAVSVVKLYQELINKKEFVISKQLLRSATAIGAMVREAEHAESKKDFIHKLSIAQKEINETLYWLELLSVTNLLERERFSEVHNETEQIMRITTRIIKTSKANLNH